MPKFRVIFQAIVQGDMDIEAENYDQAANQMEVLLHQTLGKPLGTVAALYADTTVVEIGVAESEHHCGPECGGHELVGDPIDFDPDEEE